MSTSRSFDHGQPDTTGLLLVNLGTPDAPTPSAVRRYLAEFLWDRRVVDAPRWLWWLALNGVILRIRPRRSAHAYQQVWTPEGSPLLVLTRALGSALAAALPSDPSSPLLLRVAMRYGNPSIASVLREMRGLNLRRLLVLPLYPQFSSTTTASVLDAVAAELATWRHVPELRVVNDYCAEPAHIDALAQSIVAHRARHGDAERLLFSFHGIPARYVHEGDPYFCQCHATARRVAERVGLAKDEWAIAFQSRVGRERWVGPYTEELLDEWARAGVRSVQVACPGFAVDCLETLEEIALRARETFVAAGGERFEYVAALNDAPGQVAALAAVVARHAAGWPPYARAAGDPRECPEARAGRHAALRAEGRP
jgi:protoporphyrin/coproporphyrin ferrochelatase